MSEMKRQNLANTDLELSRVCLGTMTFGGQVNAEESKTIVDTALDRGINFVDTAINYTQGESERILGDVLKGRRDQVVLASKVFNRFGEGAYQCGLSREAILAGVEVSLQRLQTDYLDICYFHAPDYAVPMEESLRAMEDLVRAGKVRYLGVSNYASWQLTQLRWIAQQEGLPEVRIAQPMYNLIARGIEQEFLPACQEFGVANVVYNPLAGGLLTGKHRAEKPIAGTRFATNAQYVDRYWREANFAAVERLQAIASGAGRSLISVAFNWLLHHTPTDGIVLGASCLEHLTANLDAIEEGALSGDVVEACDAVWADLRGGAPRYNR